MDSYSENVWIEKRDGNVEPFVGFFLLLQDKTTTMLKTTDLAVYSVLSFVLHVLPRRRK